MARPAPGGDWRAAQCLTTPAARLMGLPFDPVTMASAVERCLEWCEGPRGRPHTVITANAGILCMMRRDPELAEPAVPET